ncbi:hypothetical protein C8J56DRAFT_787260 [Mycena floridula]|nr:hypothetical protein C8J56DRAFT_787260 [Mycena floridula]
MRHHYSRDLKRRVVYQSNILGYSTTQICQNLDMPLRVVQRVLQVYNEIGEVCRDRKRLGRSPLMTEEAARMMLALLEHSPDIFLDEIQVQLEVQHGLELSISTIYRTLKQLGITNKKANVQLSREAAERSAEARRDFSHAIAEYPPTYLVCADESAVNILTTYRLNGWSFHGTRAHKQTNFVRGPKSVFLALSMNISETF